MSCFSRSLHFCLEVFRALANPKYIFECDIFVENMAIFAKSGFLTQNFVVHIIFFSLSFKPMGYWDQPASASFSLFPSVHPHFCQFSHQSICTMLSTYAPWGSLEGLGCLLNGSDLRPLRIGDRGKMGTNVENICTEAQSYCIVTFFLIFFGSTCHTMFRVATFLINTIN